MTDMFGLPVAIGDRVVYITGSQGNQYLEIGTIHSISFNDYYTVKIETASGRITPNGRNKNGIMSIQPTMTQHPELFI